QNIAASAVNTLTVRPAAGIAATVSGSVNGSLLELDGADHVTIDGVNTGGSSLALSNASTGTSASTVRFINDARMDTLRNTTLLGSGLGTSRGVVTIGTASSQGNDSLYISDNVIGPVGTSYPTVGIYSAGTNSLAGANDNVTIAGNRIHDFNGTTSSGINLASGNTGWTITGNRIYRTISSAISSGTHRLIDITSTLSGSGGHVVSGNTLGYAAADGTGVYTLTGSSSMAFRAIRYAGPTSSPVNSTITGNIIGGISMVGSTTYAYGENTKFSLIHGETGLVEITDNVIGSQTGTDDIVHTGTSTSSSYIETYGIAYSGYQGVTISGNTLGGLSITPGGSNSYYRTFSAIAVVPTSSTAFTATVSGNTIGGTVPGSIQNLSVAGNAQLRGIQFGTPMHGNHVPHTTVEGNVVRNLQAQAGNYHQANYYANSYVNESSLTGIWYQYATSMVHTITGNRIDSLVNIGTGAHYVQGISFYSTSSTGSTISGNTIRGLEVPNSTSSANVTGLLVYGSGTNT